MTIKTVRQEAGKEGDMRTISIMNLKGGVAKTTSADNMAYILSKRGYRVLMVDNDKQGDLSRGFKRRTTSGDGINCIMTDDEPDMETLIKHTDYENLDIITANLTLLNANREVEMDVTRTHHDRIKAALNIVRDQYDFALIDCPPDLNIGVVNALCASNDVLIPVEIDDNTTEGMEELWQQISKILPETGLRDISARWKFKSGRYKETSGAGECRKEYSWTDEHSTGDRTAQTDCRYDTDQCRYTDQKTLR